MVTQRKRQKAATREALRQAALRCFASDGFQATGIGQITREAGVAHGTFYVHYESREALLDELLAEFNTGLAEALRPIWTGTGQDLDTLLVRSAETFLDYWEARRSFVEVYAQKLSTGVTLSDLQGGMSPQVAELLTGRLVDLAAGLGQTLPHAPLVIQALLALWARIGLHALFNPEVSRKDAIDLLTRLTRGMLQSVLSP